MQANALKIAHKYEQDAKERLRRMNIISAGLDAAGSKKQVPGPTGAASMDEAWYEENKNLAISDGIQS